MFDSMLISADHVSEWMNSLQSCMGYDIYHLPQYHLMAEKMGEGKPYLYFFKNHGEFAAIPFLLRPIAEIEGLETSRHNDITSVYGYPGVIASIGRNHKHAEEFRSKFQEDLLNVFKELSVVAFFSRTNPLLPNTWLLDGGAKAVSLSTTVAIDLCKTNEEQMASMTKGHKYDIRKARKRGVVVEEDESFQDIDDFIRIYNETMKRNSASDYYYFPKDYYLQLKERLGKSIRLFFARFCGRTVSASIFFFQRGIIQYHLSGGLLEFSHLNGTKLILDEIRQSGKHNGYSWLHLGGGVGSFEDSLFRFKAGFSKVRLPFQIVSRIIDQNAYSELWNKKKEWARKRGIILPETNFFPKYRK